jgi:F-type H+-transporting ATPase subunit a
LFGIRAPSSDILYTFSLALLTFFLINYYGLSRKGVMGRLEDFTKPSPFMAPIKLVTDLAIPISMACRLFGNMLAGGLLSS